MPIEVFELHFLATHCDSSHPIFCEVGTWKGKSAYVLGSAAKAVRGRLYCIDPFTAVGDAVSARAYQESLIASDLSLYDQFLANIKKYGLQDVVTPICQTSSDAINHFPECQIDLLFIDGNHDFDYVVKDYLLWHPLIKKNGHIIFHDVGAKHTQGPRKVVEKYIYANAQWADVRMVGEMVVARKAM